MLGRTVGYKGYVVHCDGRVWRPTQTRVRKDGVSRVMRGGWVASRVRNIKVKSGGGYVYIGLWVDHKPEHWLLHRLIATMFIPNPNNLPEVNHRDGVKGNNEVSNLEWVTSRENRLHAWATGLITYTGCSEEAARAIWVERNVNKRKLTDIAEEFRLSFQSISRIAKGGHHAVSTWV